MTCSCLFQSDNYLSITCNSDSTDSTDLYLIQAILLLLFATFEFDCTTAPSTFSRAPTLIYFVDTHYMALSIPCTCFTLSPILTCILPFQKHKPITNFGILFSKFRHC